MFKSIAKFGAGVLRKAPLFDGRRFEHIFSLEKILEFSEFLGSTLLSNFGILPRYLSFVGWFGFQIKTRSDICSFLELRLCHHHRPQIRDLLSDFHMLKTLLHALPELIEEAHGFFDGVSGFIFDIEEHIFFLAVLLDCLQLDLLVFGVSILKFRRNPDWYFLEVRNDIPLVFPRRWRSNWCKSYFLFAASCVLGYHLAWSWIQWLGHLPSYSWIDASCGSSHCVCSLVSQRRSNLFNI